MTEIGKWLFLIGVVFCLIGGIFFLVGRTHFFDWFGRLPGDIHWQGKGIEVYVPWVSMLLISFFLSLLLSLIAIFRR